MAELIMLTYNEISNNDEVVLFEIEFKKIETIWFKKKVTTYTRKGYWNRKSYLMFYSDNGDIIHSFYDSIKNIIKSDLTHYKF